MAYEVYKRSTENLKSYMQRQWSCVGGMAGTGGWEDDFFRKEFQHNLAGQLTIIKSQLEELAISNGEIVL